LGNCTNGPVRIISVKAGGVPKNGTPPIGTPKTTEQCSIYQDGSATGAALYTLCSKVFPKPPLRTKSVGTKVSEAEFALLEERARGAGLRLAEWVREALLAAPVEPGMGSGVDSGEVALGEVLALRSLLLKLHFRAGQVR
jgi:hypothetical protein